MGRLFFDNDKNTIAEEFLDDFENAVKKISETPPKPNYKPSSISCIRAMYFIMNSMPIDKSTFSSEAIGIMESGTDRHKRIQDVLIKNDFVEYINVAEYVKQNNLDYLIVKSFNEYETHLFDTRYKLSFLADGVIRYKNKLYILEIKTETSNKYYTQSEIPLKHIQQVSCYSLSLGIDNVLFIYENRDLLSKKVYTYKVSKSDKNAIIKKIEMCNKYIEKNIIPPKPIEAVGSFCNYCNYRKYCR